MNTRQFGDLYAIRHNGNFIEVEVIVEYDVNTFDIANETIDVLDAFAPCEYKYYLQKNGHSAKELLSNEEKQSVCQWVDNLPLDYFNDAAFFHELKIQQDADFFY